MSYEEPPSFRNAYGLLSGLKDPGGSIDREPAMRARVYRDPMEDDEYLTLLWHGEKYKVKLPEPELPLSTLRKVIEAATGVKPEHQKLLMHGTMLKKDLPLKTYGLIRPSQADAYGNTLAYDDEPDRPPPNAIKEVLASWGLGKTPFATGKKPRQLKLTMVASKEATAVVADHLPRPSSNEGTSSSRASRTPEPPTAAPASADVESSVTARIDALVREVTAEVQPQIDAFNADTPRKTLLYLSERLLQTLLKLDGFEIQRDWQTARKARKEAIRTIQAELDKVDAVKDQARSK